MNNHTLDKKQFEVNTTPVGTVVSQKLIEELLNARPAASLQPTCTQVGKAYAKGYNHKNRKFQPLYPTFKYKNRKWIYCGLCFYGENKPPDAIKIPID